MKQVVCILAILLAFAVPASAQSVVNPGTATFTASADHASVGSYVIGYFAPGATAPVQEVDLGKPTPDASQVCTVSINTKPLSFGLTYTAKVRAVAGSVSSEWSEASNPFDRLPGKAGKPVVK